MRTRRAPRPVTRGASDDRGNGVHGRPNAGRGDQRDRHRGRDHGGLRADPDGRLRAGKRRPYPLRDPQLHRPRVHELEWDRPAGHPAGAGEPQPPAADGVRADRPLPPDLRADQARRGDRHPQRRGRRARSRRLKGANDVSSERTQRDGESWAKPVERLEVAGVQPGSSGINVAGRRPTSPVQGFGRMWQKTYRVRLLGADVTPQQVIAVWKRDFPSFWPKNNRFFAPLAGIQPGEVAVLDLGMPGGMKLSTGVLVMYADEESFTLMTPQGHMFAGWITFSAFDAGDGVVCAQAQVLM